MDEVIAEWRIYEKPESLTIAEMRLLLDKASYDDAMDSDNFDYCPIYTDLLEEMDYFRADFLAMDNFNPANYCLFTTTMFDGMGRDICEQGLTYRYNVIDDVGAVAHVDIVFSRTQIAEWGINLSELKINYPMVLNPEEPPKQMELYWVFGYDEYYPSGGIRDCIGKFYLDTLHIAESLGDNKLGGYQTIELVKIEIRNIVTHDFDLTLVGRYEWTQDKYVMTGAG